MRIGRWGCCWVGVGVRFTHPNLRDFFIYSVTRRSSTKRSRNIQEILASEASLQTDKSMNWVSLTLRFGNQTKIQRSRHPGMDTSFPRRRERDPASRDGNNKFCPVGSGQSLVGWGELANPNIDSDGPMFPNPVLGFAPLTPTYPANMRIGRWDCCWGSFLTPTYATADRSMPSRIVNPPSRMMDSPFRIPHMPSRMVHLQWNIINPPLRMAHLQWHMPCLPWQPRQMQWQASHPPSRTRHVRRQSGHGRRHGPTGPQPRPTANHAPAEGAGSAVGRIIPFGSFVRSSMIASSICAWVRHLALRRSAPSRSAPQRSARSR